MPAITPALWFDDNLEEAAEFYTSVFPNSRIEALNRFTERAPASLVRWSPARLCSTAPVFRGQRRPAVPVHRSRVVSGQLHGPRRGRLLLEPADRRRPGIAMRLVQGPLWAELADRS